MYAPHVQDSPNQMALLVRTAAAPEALLPAIKREVSAVDSAVAIYDIRTMEDVIDRSLAEERFSTLLLTGFALTALLLAAIGLYGIVAFIVTERSREIGVRMALGATRSNVLMVIARLAGTRCDGVTATLKSKLPGRIGDTGLVSRTLPSSTSISTAAAVTGFVSEASENSASFGIGFFYSRSSSPRASR